MSNVLFLVHRIPYPPDKGDKIRSYNLLKHLAAGHKVYLGTFVDSDEDLAHASKLTDFCEDVYIRRTGGWVAKLKAGLALLRGRSLSVGYYADRRMRNWVRRLHSEQQIDAVIAFSSAMNQYAGAVDSSVVLISDIVDVDSDKWRQYAEESHWPRTWVYRYEASALATWEAGVLDESSVVTVVSKAESEIVPGMNDANRRKVHVLPNGVDYVYLDPGLDLPDPYGGNRQVVVFTGAMDYFANEDGVCWFANAVWPDVRQRHPDAEFYVVGSKPTKRVTALSSVPGVTVTGRVADIRPYLRHATMAVAPLRLARGVQNKVLEALSMNLPVVATPEALRGLTGCLPSCAHSATSAADFSQAITRRLTVDADREGLDGRDYVRQYYDWSRNLSRLDAWIGASAKSAKTAAA